MNKQLSIVLILAIIIGSGTGILYYYLSNEKQETIVEFLNDENTFIILPVDINGKRYKFLWDTGTSISIVSSQIAEECGLKPVGAPLTGTPLSTKKPQKNYYSQKVDLKINDLKIEQKFLIDSIMASHWRGKIDGIIGSDIINQYYWLLDFEQRNVLISKKEQPITLQKQEKQYNMELIFKGRVSFCKIILNDSVQQTFFFDTGLGGLLATNKGKELCHDLSFQFSDQNNIKEVMQYLKDLKITNTEEFDYYMAGKEHKGFVFHDLSINGYNTKSLYATVDFDAYNRLHKLEYGKDLIGKIYITSNFLRRFKKMYYSPQDKQVSFISSPDYNGYTGVEIDQFLHTFEKTGVEKVNKE